MKMVFYHIPFFQFRVAYFDAGLVGKEIKFGVTFESYQGRGVGEQVDDYFVTVEQMPLPVQGNERKYLMLDLVPLDCSGLEMEHQNRVPRPVGKIGKSDFPTSSANDVTPSYVSLDEQHRGRCVSLTTHSFQPPQVRLGWQGHRLVMNAHFDPALVLLHLLKPHRTQERCPFEPTTETGRGRSISNTGRSDSGLPTGNRFAGHKKSRPSTLGPAHGADRRRTDGYSPVPAATVQTRLKVLGKHEIRSSFGYSTFISASVSPARASSSLFS